MMDKYDLIIGYLSDKYKLSSEEKDEFINITQDIYNHYEFKKRIKKPFLHHGNTTLGEHILEDAMKTYKMSKHIKSNDYDLKVAVTIAMLHDLYASPWQNSKIKIRNFFHKHGFRHPVEACINAINWFPELFKDKSTAEKLIDGIIHHMYPLPVSRFVDNKKNVAELQNFKKVKHISKEHINMIIESTNRGKIGKISFAKPKFKEGKIMSKADKKVSIKQFDSLSSYAALLTGKNKMLKRQKNR